MMIVGERHKCRREHFLDPRKIAKAYFDDLRGSRRGGQELRRRKSLVLAHLGNFQRMPKKRHWAGDGSIQTLSRLQRRMSSSASATLPPSFAMDTQ